MTSMSIRNFRANNQGKEKNPVSNGEHVAFLMFWLNKFVFCGKSLAIPAYLLPIAIAIHEEKPFAFGVCLLGALYDGLYKAYSMIKDGK